MRAELVGDLTAAEAQRHSEWQAANKGLHQGNKDANRKFVLAVDNAMVQSFGWGLATYLPHHRLEPLPAGTTRYFRDHSAPGASAPERRSCLRHKEGHCSFELPRVVQDGHERWPVLHVSADQGSTGHSALVWMNNALGLNMTHTFDWWHRFANDLQDSIKASGLLVLKLEYKNVCKLRHGPWRGQANHEVMMSAAEDYFST